MRVDVGFAALGVVLALAPVACVREGPPVVAAVDPADTSDAAAAPLAIVVAPSRDRCTARLRASPIKTGAGCTLDERISKSGGVLSYPCSGDGGVEATFAEHHFVGTMANGTLMMTLMTELDWEDNCHWETQQAIRGVWRSEGKTRLVWSYTEAAVSGTHCFGSCTAKADVEVDEQER